MTDKIYDLLLEKKHGRNSLRVVVTLCQNAGYFSSYEKIINDMVEWCRKNDCGWRTSYDRFKFRNKEDMTMFILRWA
jgi:predicted RNA-binding Zn ribbon-like protein